MGQMLSEPVTHKETHTVRSERYLVASSSMQGWRVTMEDAHTHILAMPGDPDAAFFAVFDGHGGDIVAEHASRQLHHVLVRRQEYWSDRFPEALQQACLELDAQMHQDPGMRFEKGGATAVCALIKNGMLYCANAGDSRAVASVAGRAEPLSWDHKPANAAEQARITAAGGWVLFNRVNGNLALSRALGDFCFKRNRAVSPERQVVTALPDVEVREITSDWEFVVLACDGIWDVMSNQEVVSFVRARLGGGCSPERVCEELLQRCLASDMVAGVSVGCDNMTVVLVCFTSGGSDAEVARRCARPPAAAPADLPPGSGEEAEEEDGEGEGEESGEAERPAPRSQDVGEADSHL